MKGRKHNMSIRRKSTSTRLKDMGKYGQLYILAFLPIVYFAIFHYMPMLGIIIAFKDYNPLTGFKGIFTSRWVGFEYFKDFFGSYFFSRVFFNTIKISVLRIVFGFPAPIILALLINEIRCKNYKRIVQTISYLPHFLSWVIVSSIFYIILSPSNGFINQVVKHLGGETINFLGSDKHFLGVLVSTGIWKDVGWSSILYLAAISNIDLSMYEAAKIDGASRFQNIWYITIPSIVSIISIKLILSVGNVLNAGFEQIFLLYSPLVYNVADIIDTYTYREGLVNLNYSFGTAVSLTKSVIALGLIIMTDKATKKIGMGGLW